MANSIVQNLRGADVKNYGKIRRALNNEFLDLGHVFAAPELSRSPDYIFDVLTDDAVAFTAWDSDDPLNNSNAEVGGQASPALVFAANTLTPVYANVILANDDTVGMIAVRALVLGSATAPTLVAAFDNQYRLKATFSSAAATRVLAESTPGFTITSAATEAGQYTIALPAASAGVIQASVDHTNGAEATEVIWANPNNYVTATGAGEINLTAATAASAVPDLTAPTDTHVLHVLASIREANGHVFRHTQDSADTGDTLLKFAINTTPTPDSLIVQVTGITGAELRWHGNVWIGDPQPIAFRDQA